MIINKKHFTVDVVKEEDFLELSDWYEFWRFPMPPRAMLPDDLINSVMIKHNGINLCCGFIYKTSSSMLFWSEYIVSNPKVKSKEIRDYGFNLLLNGIEDFVKTNGGKVIFTSVKNENLIKRLEDALYIKGSTSTTEMIKIV